MARKNDPFAVERRAKKKEKPEKRQKDTFSAKGFGFESKDSVSFGGESKKEKPKKEPKAAKAQKESSFGFEEKKKPKKEPKKASKISFSDKKEKKSSFDDFEKKSKKPVRLTVVLGSVIAFAIVLGVALAFAVPAFDRFQNEVVGIEITQLPKTLIYTVGDEIDYTGLRVTVTRRNGETFIVRAADCEITGFDSDNARESCIIAVKYGGLRDFFSVTVNERIKVDPIVKGISLSPMPKTEYKVGEWLDVSGSYIVIEYYNAPSSKVNLMKTNIDGWKAAYYGGPGEYELTVNYKNNAGVILATTTYTITITE